ncbi:MAG: molybdate ABC transporter substrate-binding protein [Dehalococcoidia bacterium]|nr:molybdate ABC transporter substrate-binding protein [Dehalococcoidia bacterium]
MIKSRRFRWSLVPILLVVAFAFLLAACGSDDDDDAESTPASPASPAATTPASTTAAATSPTPVPVTGEVVVFAASSLTNAFKEAGTRFEEKNPEAKVTFNFAASSALATQINEGAPADVFASADANQMKNVTGNGNAAESVIFAANLPVVVVPKSGSPVASFSDLAKPGVRLVLAGPEVPVGKYAREILANASKPAGGISADFAGSVLANVKSNEANVRAVLTKVQLGEADAGIVYSTDAAIATADVKVTEIPAAFNIIAQYPIAALKGAKNGAAARAWVAFITGPEGQAILAKFGFRKP